MLKILKLSAVSGEGDDGSVGEDDGRESAAVPTIPIAILDPADTIRSFTPRKHGMRGTRIVFRSGAGVPVIETHEEVLAAIEALYAVH